jgi:alginate O-acetyltransferase complex protein AlgI
VVIADNLAPYVQDIFKHHGQYNGSTLWLGVFYFAIQIYCDFSGY